MAWAAKPLRAGKQDCSPARAGAESERADEWRALGAACTHGHRRAQGGAAL